MEKEKLNRNIALIIIITLCILILIGTIFFVNINNRKMVITAAVVKSVGNNYIIVESDDGDEYKLKINEAKEYDEGDILDLEIDSLNTKTNPKEATITKISTINKNIAFTIEDNNTSNNDEKTNSNDDSNFNDNSTTNNVSSDSNNTSTNPTIYQEEDVINYFKNLESNLDKTKNDKTISQSVKDGFITIVDFLFYNKPINGKTFKELSSSAKLQVLKIALSIDSKIEDYFPNYKDSLSSKYQSIKSKVVAKYLDITSEICENNEDTCEAAKTGFSDMKQSFSLTWSFIKDIAGTGTAKLSSWYKIWKNS